MTVSVGKPSPPLTATREGGGDRDWVELLKARNDIEAHLLTGRLAESGIEVSTIKDRSAPGAWMYGGSNPWAPVTILVRRIDLNDARVVLAEISWDAPAYDEHSPVYESLEKKRTLMWWAAAVVVGAILTSIGVVRATASPGPCNAAVVCGGPSSTTP